MASEQSPQRMTVNGLVVFRTFQAVATRDLFYVEGIFQHAVYDETRKDDLANPIGNHREDDFLTGFISGHVLGWIYRILQYFKARHNLFSNYTRHQTNKP